MVLDKGRTYIFCVPYGNINSPENLPVFENCSYKLNDIKNCFEFSYFAEEEIIIAANTTYELK